MAKFRFVLLLMAFFVCPVVMAAEPAAKPEITVVYWGSKDCTWCTYWESGLSGMEKNFRASPEFQKIKFYKVKNDRLKDPYIQAQFPAELSWLWESYQDGRIRNPGRPGWQVFVDRKRVATFQGTKEWEGNYFPKIRQIVADSTPR